ncbi:MAG: MBL fold metallo-hydrolase [Anaerolineae bacterium]|nr:MBL fold metallo-hydrolase [Anaerolineae bacterium]
MKNKIIKLSVTNCYLIKNGADKYILIDTGYADEWELFNERLNEQGLKPADISHIILTHHHDDHCGLLNRLTALNPAMRVVMSAKARELLLLGKNDRSQGGGLINRRVSLVLNLKQFYISWVLKKKIDKKDNLTFPLYHVRPNDIVLEGETRLENIGIDLPGEIIETPGHCADSISILFDDGDCFVGDAAANFLQFTGTKYCVIFVTDLDSYYRSWQKIISKQSRLIYPAHGKVFPVGRLQENLFKNKTENMVLFS